MVVSYAAVAGSGMIRATSRPARCSGGLASSTVYISAQNPPVSGRGDVAQSRLPIPV